jgi:GDPmannose 4,6-dehydratase
MFAGKPILKPSGIGGQDGTYLCELLLRKGYSIHGLLRQRSTEPSISQHLSEVISEGYKASLEYPTCRPPLATSDPSRVPQPILHFGDILDPFFILNILRSHAIDEIYHFAAQSHVGNSWDIQLYTSDVTALGTLRIIQAITILDLQKKIKFYNVRVPFALPRTKSEKHLGLLVRSVWSSERRAAE